MWTIRLLYIYIYNIHIIYGKKHTYTDTFTAHAIDIPWAYSTSFCVISGPWDVAVPPSRQDVLGNFPQEPAMISFTWALGNSGELGATRCSGMNRSRWYLVSTWNRSCEPCISGKIIYPYIYNIELYIYIYVLFTCSHTWVWMNYVATSFRATSSWNHVFFVETIPRWRFQVGE